jgi:hypothetical protein
MAQREYARVAAWDGPGFCTGRVRLWHQLWHEGSRVNRRRRFAVRTAPRIRLARAPTTENAPAGSRGDFWGYYREERYVSLYMWIRGR